MFTLIGFVTVLLSQAQETDSLLLAANADEEVCTIHNDTTWKNPALGTQVHLQRLCSIDTLVIKKRNITAPLLETFAINAAVWGYDHFLFDKGWANVKKHHIEHNLKCTWILDNDSYSGNQFSHPFHGSMFYNSARYHGNNYYTAALYPLVGSMVWEYFCETNEPSYNDLLSTGFGGSAIGEVTYRLSDIVFDNSKTGINRLMRELIGGFLNPSRGFHRLFAGQMWKVSPSRGKMVEPEPFSIDVGIGNRYMHEMRHEHRYKNVGYVDFNINYGLHFDGKNWHKPFDYFRAYAQLNLSTQDPTFSKIELVGRVATKQWMTDHDWKFDLGLYQIFRYIDNYGKNGKSESRQRPGDYALLNEACSFGGGMYAEKESCRFTFSNDFMLDAIPFGGTSSDYYRPSRYNFASGFSLSDNIRFCLNNRLVIGDEGYFARLFVFKGAKTPDPTLRNRWFWGDKGNNSVFMNRAYLNIGLFKNLKLNLEHRIYYRRSNYAVYKSVHAKSYEILAGLTYAL